MRGKLGIYLAVNNMERITPAHAGKTKKKDIPFLHLADHPRACGENRKWVQ